MTTLLRDLRFAFRLLAKDRGFTITAFLTLAICIGANTVMFSIVRSVVLKPLPFPGSERIALLYNSYPNAGAPRVGAATPDYFDRQTAVLALDQQALFRREGRRCSCSIRGATSLPSGRSFIRSSRIPSAISPSP
jgi:hypothetical protein